MVVEDMISKFLFNSTIMKLQCDKINIIYILKQRGTCSFSEKCQKVGPKRWLQTADLSGDFEYVGRKTLEMVDGHFGILI